MGGEISPSNQRSQMPSLAACVAATYSASAVDKVISSCLRELHEMVLPSMRKVLPEMALLCSCNALSASVYPT